MSASRSSPKPYRPFTAVPSKTAPEEPLITSKGAWTGSTMVNLKISLTFFYIEINPLSNSLRFNQPMPILCRLMRTLISLKVFITTLHKNVEIGELMLAQMESNFSSETYQHSSFYLMHLNLSCR